MERATSPRVATGLLRAGTPTSLLPPRPSQIPDVRSALFARFGFDRARQGNATRTELQWQVGDSEHSADKVQTPRDERIDPLALPRRAAHDLDRLLHRPEHMHLRSLCPCGQRLCELLPCVGELVLRRERLEVLCVDGVRGQVWVERERISAGRAGSTTGQAGETHLR